MSDPTDHPFYDFTLKMVLWGETREKIYRTFETNKINPLIAEEIYNLARSERIRTIRKACAAKLTIGIPAILASIALFCLTWFGIGFTSKLIIIACTLSLAYGVWKAADGLAGFLYAPYKEGPIDDD